MATSPQASASSSSAGSSQASSSNGTSSSSPQSFSASPVPSTDSSPTPATTTSNAPTSTSSTPTPTTTPTSAAPTTTTPAATTPATSPVEGQTTTSFPTQANSGSSTGSAATTAAPTTASSVTFTSQVATTLLSTNPAGSVVYYTTTVPEVVSTTVSTPSLGHSGSSHTGVIVGSVVGGVAGLALIVLLLFCIRRRVRNDEFDGNFDPDHVGGRTDVTSGATLPQVDFAEEVTPFPHPDNGSMRQYGETPYLALPSSPGTSGQLSSEFYAQGMDAQPQPFMRPGAGPPPSGYIPPVNLYGAASEWSRTSPPPSTVSNRTSSARGAKEREAAGRQGLGLATQPEAGEGSGEVVVHQDAGRAPSEEHAPPREIPPSYDSIRQD